MKKLTAFLLSCILLFALLLPVPVLATEAEETGEEELWSNEFSRIMDITDSLSKNEMAHLSNYSMDILREYHLDVAIAAIPESRLQGDEMEEFATGLYESCDFGYGDSKDGFMCLYIEDTEALAIVPMGSAVNLFPEKYLNFMEERIPSLRENNGVFGVFYGCQELVRSGLETLAENAAGETEPEPEPETVPVTEPEATSDQEQFARCGEGSDKPAWFPANLDEAFVYFDAAAPRVVDYTNILSDATEAAMEDRIAAISMETGKDIVVVTDVSNYGLGNDIYAADFYDYNGYGIGPEHEGILLFLNLDPNNRGGWTVETGTETRALATQSAANRLDDFLYETLASGDYERALTEWVEDVYDFFTTGIARPAFWYRKDIPENYYDPDAPVVVDESGVLTAEQIATLQARADAIKNAYSVNVYFHTTGDRMDMSRKEYYSRYMASMGYEKDAILFAVECSDSLTNTYSQMYLYGAMAERISEKFQSRITGHSGDNYNRLFEGQRLLSFFLEKGRVPRSGSYWSMIAVFAVLVGFCVGVFSLAVAKTSMRTIGSQKSAYSYLDLSQTKIWKISEILLYVTTSRVYVPPRDTSSDSSSSSSGGSSYKSSYSGHSGTSHTGHGRNF